MKQNTKTDKSETLTVGTAPQTKRYDAAFKQAVVANWLKTSLSQLFISSALKTELIIL